MLKLSYANASVIQGLIAPKGLDCLKALVSWKVVKDYKTIKRQNNKKTVTTKRQNDKKTVTLFLRAPLVAIGAQKSIGAQAPLEPPITKLLLLDLKPRGVVKYVCPLCGNT